MKQKQYLTILVAILMSMFIVPWAFSETPVPAGSAGPSDYEESLASVEDNLDAVIAGIIDKWRAEMDANEDYAGWDAELAAALESAPADKVLVASQAESYAEVAAALFGTWTGPDVTSLEDGQSPEDMLFGENFRDLVFNPLTPCRIIDTRFTAAGRIGPSSGRQFQVNLANFNSQGGFGGQCGVPLGVEPAAVAINVTSTGQLGPGNIRVINTGGGVPNVSLLNYTPGTNLANAAIVRSSIVAGDDIFIFATSATHVVVDIMGWFGAPLRTAVDNLTLNTGQNVANNTNYSIFSPICPVGWRLTGGGFVENVFSTAVSVVAARPVRNTDITQNSGAGTNQANRYVCQGRNQSGGTHLVVCYSICARTPGR